MLTIAVVALIGTALLGLHAFAIARLVQKLVPLSWLSRRPWGCPVCMSWHAAFWWPPSAAIALVLLEWTATLAPADGPPVPGGG